MSDLRADLEDVRQRAGERLAAATTAAGVEELRSRLLGRSGELTTLLRQLGTSDAADRPALGQLANEVRDEVERAVAGRLEALRGTDLEARLAAETLDMSLPGRSVAVGHLHPTLTVMRDVREIFRGFGFEVFEGPEIETDEYNFELLNIPPDHPSRDLWDTLYVAEPGIASEPARDGTILRTHTSPVQIRAMRALDAPIRVLMPGRCFRYEAVDASHSFEFFQIEGLVVDRETSLADLKGMLEQFAHGLYGPETATRFRPGYYPFTEPSVAFDVECLVCGGSGCPACSRTGWMTILGAGMVHPVVLQYGGLDPERFQGFAFGMGVERIANLRHSVGDLRLYMENDLRFLEQFR